MKAKEIRDKKIEDLQKTIVELKRELFNLRFQKVSAQLTNTARIRDVRRGVARLKTILQERSSGKTKA
jgi:large subunit ribosomal protein L29